VDALSEPLDDACGVCADAGLVRWEGSMSHETTVIRWPASSSQNFELQLLALSVALEPEMITDAWVLHDTWCAVYHGHACNCNLAIEVSVGMCLDLGEGRL
jgi:hypothetical protein